MPFPLRLTATDVLNLLGVACGVLAVLAAVEFARRRFDLPQEASRKAVHVGTGLLVFFAPMLFTAKLPVLLLALSFTLLNALAYRLQWLSAVHRVSRRSFGTVYYPFALFLLALLFWESSPGIVVAAMSVMALGDGLAGIVGELLPAPHMYRVTGDQKSIEGSATMFLASLLALALSFAVYGLPRGVASELSFTSPLFWAVLTSVALFATAWEGASSRGMDNLTVPIMTGLALFFCLSGAGQATRFACGTLLGAAAVLASLRLRFLQSSGAVAAFLLAVVCYGCGGWMWTVPMLVFFIPSSLLSRWKRRRKAAFENLFDKGGTRDAWQVAANGGIPGLLAALAVVYPHPWWFALYAGSLAAVTTDTWATELGVLSPREPRHILQGTVLPRGSSGAVSLTGFAAGAAGAASIAATVMAYLPWPPSFAFGGAVVLAGLGGSLADSILGATAQAQYRCAECGRETEKRRHCDASCTRMRGAVWMTNDAVNACCAAVGAISVLIFCAFLF
jgi:uncharacterized protein (TIGR00297 family)